MAKKKQATGAELFEAFKALPMQARLEFAELLLSPASPNKWSNLTELTSGSFVLRKSEEEDETAQLVMDLLRLSNEKKNKKMGRTEDDPDRNDEIVYMRFDGKSLGQIAKTLKISIESVKGVLKRRAGRVQHFPAGM